MRILLAGGAGFIGSHVADALLARGDEVVAVDNLSTGRASNVAHLENNPRFVLIEHDITQSFPPHRAFADCFEAVMDLASPASPSDFATMPLEILAVGSTGTRALLDIAVSHRARFLLASTSEVYGDPLVHPQPETYWGNVSPIGPRSCYDEAKRFSEALTMAYRRVHGLEVRIVRIFNTYGERMRPGDGRVVNTFIEQALRGEPITLHGDGKQTRSFCHVEDEVRGIVALLDSNINEPVNIGNPNEFTMEKLAELVLSITGSKSPIVRVPLPAEREGDPLQRCPAISLARDLLGWEPRITLSEGLPRMIHHFRTHEGFA
jgi:dTDP-glucose 4,6-dehydratase